MVVGVGVIVVVGVVGVVVDVCAVVGVACVAVIVVAVVVLLSRSKQEGRRKKRWWRPATARACCTYGWRLDQHPGTSPSTWLRESTHHNNYRLFSRGRLLQGSQR